MLEDIDRSGKDGQRWNWFDRVNRAKSVIRLDALRDNAG